MGICFSSKSSSASFNCIRVVHLNGCVEDFDEPVTVKQITSIHPKHYLCTIAQLLPNSKQLPSETLLQPGKVYFLLPHSIFQSDTSPVNMVSIATRLAAIANRSKKAHTKGSLVPNGGLAVTSDDQKLGIKTYKEQNSWKPILDSIIERSMEYRCESDLITKLGR